MSSSTHLWQGTPHTLISKLKKVIKSPIPKLGSFENKYNHHRDKKHAEIAIAWAEECINGQCSSVYLVERDGQHYLTTNLKKYTID